MTLEQQVHDLEVRLRRAEDRIARLTLDSHPPVDFLERICEALNSGELMLGGSTDTGRRVYVEAGRLKGHTSR